MLFEFPLFRMNLRNAQDGTILLEVNDPVRGEPVYEVVTYPISEKDLESQIQRMIIPEAIKVDRAWEGPHKHPPGPPGKRRSKRKQQQFSNRGTMATASLVATSAAFIAVANKRSSRSLHGKWVPATYWSFLVNDRYWRFSFEDAFHFLLFSPQR